MLRVSYFILVLLICAGVALLGLWPVAIKPRLHSWMSQQLERVGTKQGLILRTDEFNITGFSEIELVSARIDDAKKQWSLQAPLVTLNVSLISLLFGTQPLRRAHLLDPVFIGTIADGPSSELNFEIPPGIKEITIDNAFVQVEDPAHQFSIRVSHFNARMQKRSSAYKVKASTSEVWAELKDASFDLTNFAFSGSLREDKSVLHLDIRSLAASLNDSSITLNGELDLDKDFKVRGVQNMGFQVNVDLHQLLQPRIPETKFAGLFFGQGLLTLNQGEAVPQAQGRFGTRDLMVDGVNVSLLDGAFKFDNRVVSLSEVEALFGGTLVRLDAQIEPENDWHIGVAAHIQKMSLYDMLQDLGIKPVFVDMNLDARIEAEGALWPNFHLSGNLNAQGKDFFVADRNARQAKNSDLIMRTSKALALSSDISIDSRGFRFKQATISDGFSFIDADCDLNFNEREGLRASVKSEKFDFQSIGETIASQTYKGFGSVTAMVNGPYNDIRIEATTTLNGFLFEGYELGQVKSTVTYVGDDLVFSDAHAETSHATLAGSLAIAFKNEINLDLHVANFKASLPQALRKGDDFGINVRGLATGSLNLRGPIGGGTLLRLQGSAHVAFNEGVTINEFRADDLDFKARANADSFFIDSALASIGNGKAYVNGTIQKRDFDASLTVKGQNISLNDFSQLEGGLNTEFTINGKLDDPNLKGSIDLIDLGTEFLALGDQHVSFEPTANKRLSLQGHLLSRRTELLGEAEVNWQKRSVNLHKLALKSKEGDQVDITGLINQSTTDLAVRATLNLDTLRLSYDDLESIQGLLKAQIQLTGDIFDPSWLGFVEITNGSLKHALIPYPIDKILAHVTLSQKDFTLKSFKGACGSGVVDARGRGVISGYGAKELESRINLNAVPIESETLAGQVNGYLDFRKLQNELSLSGDLRISDGFMLSDIKADDFRFNSQSPYSGSPLRLDVRVKSQDPVRVDTDMLSGELELNLQIVGTHLSPGLVGSAEIKAGQAQFRNQNYQLQKARVDFDDAYHIVPRLDVLATGNIDNYAVQLRLQGTPEKPHLQLTSDPYLPESQLLVLMSLGYAAQDIKGFASTARTTGLEALSLYLGLGSNVMRFLNKRGSSDFLRLEELSLSPIFSKAEGVSVPAVKLGMNVWSGLKLRLHSTLVENNGKREQRIELEQSLGRQMKWRLGWDSDGLSNYGDAGFDLWYRWELD